MTTIHTLYDSNKKIAPRARVLKRWIVRLRESGKVGR